ncbi:hypothetical protein NMCA_22940 [Enterobacter ludwigii]|nr:hypothetical protein NMCA_22940 [Enterobacter ludwigii]
MTVRIIDFVNYSMVDSREQNYADVACYRNERNSARVNISQKQQPAIAHGMAAQLALSEVN